MARATLKPEWNRWCLKRRSELCVAGASPKLAGVISRAEAKGRQRVESCAGRRSALAAELTVVLTQDGSEKIVMLFDPNLIEETKREAAYRALGIRAITVPASHASAGRASAERPPWDGHS